MAEPSNHLPCARAVGELLDGNGDALGHARDVGELQVDETDAAPLHLGEHARALVFRFVFRRPTLAHITSILFYHCASG